MLVACGAIPNQFSRRNEIRIVSKRPVPMADRHHKSAGVSFRVLRRLAANVWDL
jgi:hypothetical protein